METKERDAGKASNVASLFADATANIVEAMRPLFESAGGDAKAWAADVAKAVAVAAATGRTGALEDVQAQALLYGEVHRLRMTREAKEQVRSLVGALLRVALSAVELAKGSA